MKNLRDINFIPQSIQKPMIEFNLTLNDIDNMNDQQFSEFCAQLEEKQLKSLDGILTNDKWKSHIFTVLDNAAFIANRK